MKKLHHFLWVGLLLSTSSSAELAVIADLGGESAVRFYEGIQPELDENAPIYPNAIPESVTEVDMLPVVSHKLTPGYVKPIDLELTGMSPIFLIGADELSRQWLSQHYDNLLSQQAVGLVVNVTTLDELNQLRRLAPNLTLLPSPADDLSDRLKLSHYPALITETGVSQ
ncbi:MULTISPECIES: integrating conjugative element protein [Rodentibacter]|uniref:Integrating conjugative element protein n=2 Tax=Rodentibacter TaxID=1960084 RepID=A0A1V3JM50_9PAST|nr:MULTISPECIES: integrating conjugative element protein [Rodentibacter]OOF38275.1 integrating conjugative element protein [Rodentibacter mrazii]OOF57499.1 integrating conjugative element protein [Rodentibacter genomosp. 2]